MLEIENVSKRYGETVALSGASIAFKAGTVHTILGENGSGKSTMVKLLSGIVQPDGGVIRLDGRPFCGHTPAAFQTAGFATVFQEVLIAPDRTVTDNILLGLDGLWTRRIPRAERRATAEAALRRFAITEVSLDAPAGSLPLAAQQLVVLARAVVRRPRVLILDEVTAALDYADRESVFRMMRELAREGSLLLFITHRMDEVMSLSDRISILRGGKVVKTEDCGASTPAELLKAMAPQTAAELTHA
ncbi:MULTISPECIES: ATP-binding cassette domain-containing protein [unclassified Rhizobium]|jgi:ABC-type sugar transport system ATPase subunit|uniref:ATP-binding cassette domain-containing protein n=1 Tax=unclassified Rhizobium TaxID=2613769 RepID=UPI000648EB02|nr:MULTISPECIES: ATP-binding cassette domain-containing protein [unclassified Rhizobium]MBN8952499.1 sugar ABC transporter ATP-binding protein [Rhizobium tropici]OJY78975.1 MAG: ABC transporter [Rhizobium sp. 60-20]RKD67700.1 ribose transport system ATP-binding protein [Rhizobium sp. WW_1]